MVRGPWIRSPRKTVSVLMPMEMYEQIKKQAERTGRSVPSYIRQVLRCYLWHVENAPEELVKHWRIL